MEVHVFDRFWDYFSRRSVAVLVVQIDHFQWWMNPRAGRRRGFFAVLFCTADYSSAAHGPWSHVAKDSELTKLPRPLVQVQAMGLYIPRLSWQRNSIGLWSRCRQHNSIGLLSRCRQRNSIGLLSRCRQHNSIGLCREKKSTADSSCRPLQK